MDTKLNHSSRSGAVLAPPFWESLRGLRRGAGQRTDFAGFMYQYAAFDMITKFLVQLSIYTHQKFHLGVSPLTGGRPPPFKPPLFSTRRHYGSYIWLRPVITCRIYNYSPWLWILIRARPQCGLLLEKLVICYRVTLCACTWNCGHNTQVSRVSHTMLIFNIKFCILHVILYIV